MRIQDSFKGHFFFVGYSQCIKKVLALEVLEVLEKVIKQLKRRERIKEKKSLKLKTLCYIHIKL